MKEERIMVLTMLKEGRINVEEATHLLEVLSTNDDRGSFRAKKRRERTFDKKFIRASESVESFAKDVSNKFEETYKDIEPRFKKVSQTVIEKTTHAVDQIAKSLNETLADFQKPTKEEREEFEEMFDDVIDNVEKEVPEDTTEKPTEDNIDTLFGEDEDRSN